MPLHTFARRTLPTFSGLSRLSLLTGVALMGALAVPVYAGAQAPATDAQAADPAAPNPLATQPWFVDEENHAWLQWKAAARQGREGDAFVNQTIAIQPKFRWFGRSTRPNPTMKIRDYIERAEAKGQIPLMATLRHHGTSCGPTYDGGGQAEDERFKAWYRMLADAVGNHRVVIAYEPDSLGTLDCLKKSRRKTRVATLRYGIDILSKLPNATVYIEAGASDWESERRTASLLRQVGIAKVRGFFLNSTHYDWTANNIRYGREVSRRTGGKHFIINTSGNGRGPVHYQQWKSASAKARRKGWHRVNIWCNAKMRGLGIAPTTKTHDPLVDAYMWINRPGVSSGTCNGGKKKENVGAWTQPRANMWVKYRTDWILPPTGTRHGHFSKPSILKLAEERFVKLIKRPF